MTLHLPSEPQLPTELADALRDGPFHRALDLAIKHRRLSLEAVQRRLAGQGARMSQATLSYWRRGRRQPEGERSLRAVCGLERSLGLPDDSLVRLVGPQRARGAAARGAAALGAAGSHLAASGPVGSGRVGSGAVASGLAGRAGLEGPVGLEGRVGLDVALDIPAKMMTAFDGIDINANLRLSIISIDQTVRLGADRAEELVSSRIAVTSRVDGADRWVCFFYPKAESGHLPALLATHGCRPGRVRTSPTCDLLAVELSFDYRLRVGDTYLFGYDIGYLGTPPRSTTAQYGIRSPVRQLALQVQFHPDAVPVRCYRFHQSPLRDGMRTRESELPVGASLVCHQLLLDAQPSVYGIRWEWE